MGRPPYPASPLSTATSTIGEAVLAILLAVDASTPGVGAPSIGVCELLAAFRPLRVDLRSILVAACALAVVVQTLEGSLGYPGVEVQ
jgi:hypothetical protein